MNYKKERILKLIRNEIMSMIVSNSLKDPRIPNLITLTKITLSKDLHYCHVYFTVMAKDMNLNTIADGLNSATGFIQKNIGAKLQLRFTPKIEFRYDEDEKKADRIDGILDELTKQRANNQPKSS